MGSWVNISSAEAHWSVRQLRAELDITRSQRTRCMGTPGTAGWYPKRAQQLLQEPFGCSNLRMFLCGKQPVKSNYRTEPRGSEATLVPSPKGSGSPARFQRSRGLEGPQRHMLWPTAVIGSTALLKFFSQNEMIRFGKFQNCLPHTRK